MTIANKLKKLESQNVPVNLGHIFVLFVPAQYPTASFWRGISYGGDQYCERLPGEDENTLLERAQALVLQHNPDATIHFMTVEED
jgi:hypothetical protein